MTHESCMFCQIIEKKISCKEIYQDDIVIAVLKENSQIPGQVMIFTKKHHTILELAPDNEIAHSFLISNKISMLLFEKLKVQGTNITVDNGISAGQRIPHFSINIIPRTENDNLDFTWQPKEIYPEEMQKIIELYSKVSLNKVPEIKEEQKKPEQKVENKEDNYMLRQLNRIP